MEIPGFTAKELYGMSKEEAQAKGICLECGEEALPKCYSAAGRREYQISGLCELCFDRLTLMAEEEDD